MTSRSRRGGKLGAPPPHPPPAAAGGGGGAGVGRGGARGMRVSLWGPYEMRRGVYRKVLLQKRFVESGRLAYQAFDVVGEAAWTGAGSNCIHAVTDADPAFGPGPALAFGYDAGSVMTTHLACRGGLLCPGQTHDWLI